MLFIGKFDEFRQKDVAAQKFVEDAAQNWNEAKSDRRKWFFFLSEIENMMKPGWHLSCRANGWQADVFNFSTFGHSTMKQ